MYESHFGLSGPPFSLNPDPTFYFQSKGHGNALSYLRFGVHQSEGFVVVTGDIGAGKTTLVRALLAELDDRSIVAAQIVSTQLEAGDLLRSVAIAFGLAPKTLSKAELIASIEAFLTLLVTQNKRALLIVDEAQNLNLQAIEELRMLSNFQLGKHALLQSFLVGQPELRELLTSKPMEQFRQRVIASCHLGPMDQPETRAYVEHRLRKVGWSDRPEISAEAYARIHFHSSGIPRRVNLLCNRLLLSAYLGTQDRIDAGTVDTVAGEADAEVGRIARPFGSEPRVAPAQVELVPVAARARVAQDTGSDGPMLCVAASRGDDVRMAMLLRALQQRQAAPPVILVRIGATAEFELNDALFRQAGLDVPTIELAVNERTAPARMAEVMREFEALVDLHRPTAVLVTGHEDATLACSLVADKMGRPIVHVDAGSDGDTVNRALISRLSRLHCVAEQPAHAALLAAGQRADDVLLAGDMLADAARFAADAAVTPAEALAPLDDAKRGQLERHGYCMVVVGSPSGAVEKRYLSELLAVVRKVSAEIPVVWSPHAALAARLDALGLRKMLRSERIALLPPRSYPESIALLGGASCVLTDSHDVRIEAQALDVPSLTLAIDGDGDAADRGVQRLKDMRVGTAPAPGRLEMTTVRDRAGSDRDGAAERIADHLIRWVGSERVVAVPRVVS